VPPGVIKEPSSVERPSEMAVGQVDTQETAVGQVAECRPWATTSAPRKLLPPDPHRFDGDKDGIGCER